MENRERKLEGIAVGALRDFERFEGVKGDWEGV
jgi:hypothetical protein